MDKNQALIKLYSQCLENNFTDMTNEKHQLKAKVFATDLGLKYKKIETLFTEAKAAYEQHQIELERSAQAAKEKVDLARKREHLQKNAKLAFTAKGYHYGELKIYRCEDGSVFCKADDEDEKYTNIEITVEAGQLYFYKYHPSKTVYTGASAGGIAMGGFHTTEAHYTQRKTSTEKGSVVIRYGKKSLDVGSVTLAPDIAILFRRVPEYKANFSKNTAICRKNNKDSDKLLTMSMYARDQGTQLEIASFAADETKIPFSKCEEIADILNNIIHNKFPVQDEEIYAKAIELSKTNDIEHLGEAVKLFEYIRDYKDAGKHLAKIRPVYDDLVQTQKEQNIIQKEKKQKKRKITTITVCSCVAFLAALFFVIIPSLKYNKAVDLIDNKKYEEAATVLDEIGDFRDASELKKEALYLYAVACKEEKNYEKAEALFKELASYGYKDSPKQRWDSSYSLAIELMAEHKYEEALAIFEELDIYDDEVKTRDDCETQIYNCMLALAKDYETKGDAVNAIKWYKKLEDDEAVKKVKYDYVLANKNTTDKQTYYYLQELAEEKYKDSVKIYSSLYKITGKVFFNESSTDLSTSKTTIPSYDSSGSHNIRCHYSVSYDCPTENFQVKVVYETRLMRIDGVLLDYESDLFEEIKVVNGEDNILLEVRAASNVYYHRVTLYDIYTGEQLAQATLYSPNYS